MDSTAASAKRLIWAGNVAWRRAAWGAMLWAGFPTARLQHVCPAGGSEAARTVVRAISFDRQQKCLSCQVPPLP